MSTRDELPAVGKQAAELLENPMLKEAHEGIEKAILEKLAHIDVTDEPHVLALVRALQANRLQRGFLQRWVTQGRLEEDALERRKMVREPIKDPRWFNKR